MIDPQTFKPIIVDKDADDSLKSAAAKGASAELASPLSLTTKTYPTSLEGGRLVDRLRGGQSPLLVRSRH